MAIPVCNLRYNPIISALPFQVSMISDNTPPLIETINPVDFTPNSNFLAFNTTTSDSVITHDITFLNETPETKIIKIRNISTIPGVWSETVINNLQDENSSLVPYSVDIIPSYTAFTMNLRWQLESDSGDFYGPYIGSIDNIKYVPSGDYILRLIDLSGNIITETNISTDDISTQLFVDIPTGTITINFDIPSDKDIDSFSYYLISDFDDTSLSDNYNDIEYELDNGLYYIVVKYENNMLIPEDDINMSVYIYNGVSKTLNITIDSTLKITSVTEG